MNAETLRELFDTLADTPEDAGLAAALADACQEADGAVLADCLAAEAAELKRLRGRYWHMVTAIGEALRSGARSLTEAAGDAPG